jgi:hypothetical protein
MNPPPAIDGTPAAVEYAGAEPLDVALADRFAFIAPVPSLDDLGPADQLAVLAGLSEEEDAAARLRVAIEDVRAAIPSLEPGLLPASAKYVQIAAGKLAEAAHPLSTRRGVQLTRNIVSTCAALQALDERSEPRAHSSPEDAFYTALRYSLPDAAWGAPVSAGVLAAVHRTAWELAGLDGDDELKRALLERDPVRRIASVLRSSLTGSRAGQIVVDAYSSLSRVARIATAAVLAPVLATRTDLPIATIEPIAREFAALAAQHSEQITVRRGGADWRRDILSRELPALPRGTAKGRLLANAAIMLLQEDHQFEMTELAAAYDHARCILLDARPRGAGAA